MNAPESPGEFLSVPFDAFGVTLLELLPVMIGLAVPIFAVPYVFRMFRILLAGDVPPVRSRVEKRSRPAIVAPAPVRLARPQRYSTACPDPECRYCHPSARQAILRAADRSPLTPPPLELWRGWDTVATRPEVKS